MAKQKSTVAVHINGLDELRVRFDNIQRGLNRELYDISKTGAEYVQSRIPPYPPPPPDSKYKRTGDLGRGTNAKAVKVADRHYEIMLQSTVPYAPWVISEQEVNGVGPQAWVHVGRWWTLQDVARKAWFGVYAIYQRGVERIIQR